MSSQSMRNHAVTGLLRAYKLTLSPALMALGVRCRHQPSCSEYAAEAVRRHGFVRGGWLGARRVLRCRPGGTHGWDPVPDVEGDAS